MHSAPRPLVSSPTWGMVFLLSSLPHLGVAQNPDSALVALPALGLDSITGGAAVTYYRAADANRGRELHSYNLELSSFARDSLGLAIATRVAVLNQQDWAKLTFLPYGFPNNFGPPANIVLAGAVRAPATGVDTLLVGKARDLAVIAHEGGHILTWSLMPAALLDSLRVGDDRISPELRRRFARFDAIPGWYWEFAATYLGIAYLHSRYPESAVAFSKYLEGLTAVEIPRYRSLDAWFETMMTSTSDAGVPFVATPAGNLNFAWYQGVVGIIAEHVHSSRRLEYLSQLRLLTAGNAAWTTVDLIGDIERTSPGLVAKLNRLGVLWRERLDVR